MELYMDEKWKLSKKGSRNNGSRRVSIGDGNSSSLLFRRSESVREIRSSSHRSTAGPAGRSFSSRCATLVKEQRARFYIMRRCVTMLVCWKDYA